MTGAVFMDIVIAVNDAYYEACRTMLHSLFTKNRKSVISIHLFYRQLTERERKGLCKYVEKLGGTFHSYIVPDSVFRDLPYEGSEEKPNQLFSIEVYYRILAYQILPKDMQRMLWLDADIVITSDISEFYSQSFDGMDLIACADVSEGEEYIAERKTAMNLEDSHIYFNSGVLLMNLEKIRRDIRDDDLRDIINRYGSNLVYPDQDLLNKIFDGKVKYADGRIYNNQLYGKQYQDSIEDACILHYVYIFKPWKPLLAKRNCSYYWKERLAMGDLLGYVLFMGVYQVHRPIKVVAYYREIIAAKVRNKIAHRD